MDLYIWMHNMFLIQQIRIQIVIILKMNNRSVQNLNEAFHKKRRRQQLQRRFSDKRKQLSKQLVDLQNRTFKELLPRINSQNYDQNRVLLSDFARSSDYSYEILPVVWIAQEYLSIYLADRPSWKILTYLSYYEDFQISQTKEFSTLIVKFIELDSLLASQFLFNISKLQKCSLLMCRLVDENMIGLLRDVLRQKSNIYHRFSLQDMSFGDRPIKQELQLQIFNILLTLANTFALRPMLQLEDLTQICQIQNSQANQNLFLKQVHTESKFKLIQNALQAFSSSRQVLELLTRQFEDTIDNFFFIYESEVLRFLKHCLKLNIAVSSNLIRKIVISIKSNNVKNKYSALQMIQSTLVLAEQNKSMEVQKESSHQFQGKSMQLSLPTLEQFNRMFQSEKTIKISRVQAQNQLRNRSVVYSALFDQNYESHLRILFQLFQNSGQKMQEQIALLIKSILSCLIKQVQNYEQSYKASSLLEVHRHIFNPENIQNFILISIEQEELFIFINQSLKSQSPSLIKNALQILQALIFYFTQKRQESDFKQRETMGLELLKKQIDTVNIRSSLELLLDTHNSQISIFADDILQELDEQNL